MRRKYSTDRGSSLNISHGSKNLNPIEFITRFQSDPSLLKQFIPRSILDSRELLVHLFDRLSARNPVAPSNLSGCDADIWDNHGLVSGFHSAMDGFAYQLATLGYSFFEGNVLELNATTCVFLSQLYAAFNRHHLSFSESQLGFWVNSLSDNMRSLAQERLQRDISEPVFASSNFTGYDPMEFPADWFGKFDLVIISKLSLIRGDPLDLALLTKDLIKSGGHLLLLTTRPLEKNKLILHSSVEIDEPTRLLYELLSKPIPEDLFERLITNGLSIRAYFDSNTPSEKVFCTLYQRD